MLRSPGNDGDGKVVVKEWKNYGVEDAQGGPSIELEFQPAEQGNETGWVQTFESNLPDVDSQNLGTALPLDHTEERLDGPQIQDRKDVTQAKYFDNPPSNNLADMPTRRLNNGADAPATWNAQSSMIINGQKSFSVGWGFSINSNTTGAVSPPVILKSNTTFHDQAIGNLKFRK